MAMELETARRNTATPTEVELEAFMAQQFGTDPAPDADEAKRVTEALMEPFPDSAIFTDDKGMRYVKYHQVIRRLISATGNRFDIDVLDQRITPHGATKSGVEKFLVLAQVRLTIPALGSHRTMTGVQVAMANTEDLFKGAVSDGVKKAAQAFGVAIDLAGDDRELATTHALHAQEGATGSSRHETPRQGSGHHTPSGSAQRPNTDAGSFDAPQPGTGGPATKPQKGRLWHMSGKDDSVVAAWAAEYGETLDTLTKGTASLLIDTKGGE